MYKDYIEHLDYFHVTVDSINRTAFYRLLSKERRINFADTSFTKYLDKLS